VLAPTFDLILKRSKLLEMIVWSCRSTLVSKIHSYYALQIAILVIVPLLISIPFLQYVIVPPQNDLEVFLARTYGQQVPKLLALTYALITPLALYLSYLLVKSTRDPVTFFQKGLWSSPTPRVEEIVESLSIHLALRTTPRVFSISVPLCLSVGTEENAALFLWRDIEKWNDDEITSIVAHELWHVKSDIESASFLTTQNNKTLVVVALGLALSLIVGFFSGLLLFGLAEYMVVLAVASAILSHLLSLVLAYFGFLRPKRMNWVLKAPFREFLADGLGAMSTGQPRIMARTIWRFAMDSISRGLPKALGGFKSYLHMNLVDTSVTRTDEVEQLNGWASIFDGIRWSDSHPKLNSRLAFLFLLDAVLNDSTSLVVTRTTPVADWNRFFYSSFVSFGHPLYNAYHTFGNVVRDLPKENFIKLWEYLFRNQRNFNLKDAAAASSVSLEQAVAFLVVLLVARIVEIVRPKLSAEDVMKFSRFPMNL
jgi:Zn-dependent protease with chaperone function